MSMVIHRIINWHLTNPLIEVYIGESLISAEEWPEGAEVYLCVSSSGFPASIDPGAWTTECDLFQDNLTAEGDPTRAFFDTSPHILGYGDYVTASDGVTAKYHQVTELELVSVDPDLDLITGRAEAGKEILVRVWDCDSGEYAIADPGGDWSVDFTGTCNIELGFGGNIRDWDDDGDSSNINWRVPNPRIEAVPGNDQVYGYSWPEGNLLHICVNEGDFAVDPTNELECSVYYDQFTVEVHPDDPDDTMVEASLEGADLQAGHYISVTDGSVEKQHLVTPLEVLAVDPLTDVVSGIASPDTGLEVFIHDDCPGCWQQVLSDGTGDWAADFSGDYDLVPGTDGGVTESDDDGDYTYMSWQVPNPRIHAEPQFEFIMAREYPEGAEVFMCVDSTDFTLDPSNPLNCDIYHGSAFSEYPPGCPDCSETEAYFDLSGPDLMPGHYITASDGVTTKQHLVTPLEILVVDPLTDMVSGIASPDTGLEVFIHDDCPGCWQWVVSDGSGDWAADFSEDYDLVPGTDGGAQEYDDDGDYTYVQWWIPNPQIHAQPQFEWIYGNDWPDGDLVYVCVDSTGFTGDPTNPLNCDVYHGTALSEYNPDAHQTEAPFDLDGEDLQPGHYITMSDGVTLKELLVSGNHVTLISVDLDTISGTGTPDTEISVGIHDDCPGCWQGIISDGFGDWTADFSGDYDLVPGSDGYIDEYDADGDVTYIQWRIPNPLFDAYLSDPIIEAYDWPEGADLYVCIGSAGYPASIDPLAWTTECDLFQDNQTVPPPDGMYTQLTFDTSPYDMVHGDYVTVSDGVTAKYHQLTELVLLAVNPDTDVVSGTAASGEEIGVWISDCGAFQLVTTDPGGDWAVDFTGTCDIAPGISGIAFEKDADGNATLINWHVPNPQIHAQPQFEWIYGNDWPDGDLVYVCVDSTGFTGDPTNPLNCDVYHGTALSEYNPDAQQTEAPFDLDGEDLQPGHYITMSDGVTLKELLVSGNHVTLISVDLDTISGTGTPDTEISVGIHDDCPGCWRGLVSDGSGDWTADFSGDYDLVPGSNGYIDEYDADGDVTYIQWRIPNPYISAEPFIDKVYGVDWLAASEVYVCIDDVAYAPGSDPTLWTVGDCSLYLDSMIATPAPWNSTYYMVEFDLNGILDLTAGLFITKSDGVHLKTHQVTDLNVLGTDHNNQLVFGTAEPVSDIHQTMFGDYPDFTVVANPDGTWSADYSGFPGWEYGTQGNAYQRDLDGDQTWITWENFSSRISVNPDEESVHASGWIIESEVNLFVDDSLIDTSIVFPNPENELQGRLEFDLDGVFDLLPGQNVCLRDISSIRERCYVVELLEVTMVDPINDEISGNAEAGEEVIVEIDGVAGSLETAFADGFNQWQVEFEAPVDLEIDSTGYAFIPNGIGDGTWIEWGHSPEIEVLGNGTSISDGDVAPDPADDTDFGSAEVGVDTIVHSFVINNGGPGSLYLFDSPSVQISGPHAADFSVTTQPNSLVIPMGGTMFQITFDPSSTGLREAEVSIANNDSDENPFNFSIQGTGIAPEMDVLGNSVSIADGDATPSVADDTDFGSVAADSGTVVHTFTIENTGDADLDLTDTPEVQISGAQAGDFTVTSQPSSPVASGGGTTTFEITFDPSATGLREAEVSIANDDSDENPYTFAIQGTGIAA